MGRERRGCLVCFIPSRTSGAHSASGTAARFTPPASGVGSSDRESRGPRAGLTSRTSRRDHFLSVGTTRDKPMSIAFEASRPARPRRDKLGTKQGITGGTADSLPPICDFHKLIPWARNPRTHSDTQVAQIARRPIKRVSGSGSCGTAQDRSKTGDPRHLRNRRKSNSISKAYFAAKATRT